MNIRERIVMHTLVEVNGIEDFKFDTPSSKVHCHIQELQLPFGSVTMNEQG